MNGEAARQRGKGRTSEKHHSSGKELFCIYCFDIKVLLHFKKNIKKLSKLSLIKLKSVYEIHEEVVLNLRVSTLRVLDDVYRD